MSESLEKFYKHLLGVEIPWKVVGIERESETREVKALVAYSPKKFECPECGKRASLHDHRTRTWRHLDSCNHKTLIKACVPRVRCEEHGVKQIPVSWAEKNSRFTAEFEQAVIVWLQDDSVKTVAENFSLSWDQVDGIMQRAVKRGQERRKQTIPEHIGIDETSFQKRHEYVSVILDKDKDSVIDVLDDRKSKTVKDWFKTQERCDFSDVKSITMDMWDPFIKAVKACFGDAEDLICFDRFHVAGHFGKALDKVRSHEHRQLANESPLNRTKHHWLKNSNRTDNRAKKRKKFMSLTKLNLKTARAWRIKEAASMLWNYTYMGVAKSNRRNCLDGSAAVNYSL